MRFKILCLVLAFLATVNSKINYDGFKLFKVIPKTVDEVESLRNIKRSGMTEFWDDVFDVNHDVRIMVPMGFQAEFLEMLENAKMEGQLIIDDVQRAINNQLVTRKRGSGSGKGSKGSKGGSRRSSKIIYTGYNFSGRRTYWAYSTGKGSARKRYERNSDTLFSLTWDRYHRLEAIYTWLDELAEAFPDRARTVVMGKSVEGRDIKGIVINIPSGAGSEKKIGMFEGGLHAREWISPATVTWIIKEFLISDDPEMVALASEFEWHIFPVVNPDGYSYTFTDHRMWRKNRSKANFVSCSGADDDMSNGVDLNRNFDFVWHTVGTSNDPCSNVYPGPSPASEPETQSIAAYVMELKASREFMYYIAFHSYTQLMVIPHSHLTSNQVLQVENYADMFEIAARAADVLEKRYNTTYSVGISTEVMYAMSGTSFDWAKNAANIPVAYLIELRDLGDYGFLLPAEEIIPNNVEIMDALLEMDRATRDLRYYERSGVGSVVASLLLVGFGVVQAILY